MDGIRIINHTEKSTLSDDDAFIIDSLTNGSGQVKYSALVKLIKALTVANAEKVNNHTVESDVPADAVFTDTNTTYAISIKGHTITLTGSDGTTTNVTVPDNDTKYDDAIKSLNDLLGGHTVKSDVPEGAVFTDTVYNDTAVRQLISDESTRAKKAESTIQQNLDGLGLKVVDGKLCAVYS